MATMHCMWRHGTATSRSLRRSSRRVGCRSTTWTRKVTLRCNCYATGYRRPLLSSVGSINSASSRPTGVRRTCLPTGGGTILIPARGLQMGRLLEPFQSGGGNWSTHSEGLSLAAAVLQGLPGF
eukprot:3312688-Prymnesium_polylepis.1